MTGTGSGSAIAASDLFIGSGNGVTLNPGQSVSLGEVAFALPSSAYGTFDLSFDQAATSLAYKGSSVPFSASSVGYVTVFKPLVAQVPEPSNLILFVLLAGGAALFMSRKVFVRQNRHS